MYKVVVEAKEFGIPIARSRNSRHKDKKVKVQESVQTNRRLENGRARRWNARVQTEQVSFLPSIALHCMYTDHEDLSPTVQPESKSKSRTSVRIHDACGR